MKQLKKPLIYESKLLKKYPYIAAGFTTKLMGDMRDLREVRGFGEKLGFPFKNLCLMKQVHGKKVLFVNEGGIKKDTDGMITNKKGLLLLTRIADCLPVLFFEPEEKIIGVCHAGRKGTELGIVKKVILKIKEKGGNEKKLIVVIGPHIKRCCYPVDLTKENIKQLVNVGIKKTNIEIFFECTCCGDNFSSYRRDGKNFLEFAGFIGIKNISIDSEIIPKADSPLEDKFRMTI